ncbi:hypothetical protein Ahy_A08g040122 [Arachis hypogaea]|uniref:CCHC-type domain-containing protein n=1 Tax=Arachis hypogaea TaxID=3818 RepID=A0A445BY86_ARAHY|nr:hypothetical protein Ahy_A08g040122 [Arachis hypogaea]
MKEDNSLVVENSDEEVDWLQVLGMPCVNACVAISNINRNLEDFCHYWLTMQTYRDTYKHFLNQILGQDLWERSQHNRPHAPNMKRKLGKDADEEPFGVKKSKTSTKLKRQYKKFTCTYCGTRGHTKRSCTHKKADDLTSALVSWSKMNHDRRSGKQFPSKAIRLKYKLNKKFWNAQLSVCTLP